MIFAFGGSALMGTCYYVVQRTGHARLALGKLAGFTFWGWQLICVLAMVYDAAGHDHKQGIRRAGMVHRRC